MRILHTSDWHLGRSFHREGMLDHQAAFVDHLLDVVESESVDVVVLAGDVYDRALPPVDAVAVADDAFARLAESRARLVITSGNHDSAERLGFAPIPEVPTHDQRGSAVRALHLTKKGRLLYSGHSGTIGEVLDQGVICKFVQHGTWTGRSLTPLGDQLIASGYTLDYAPMQVDLTRILGVQ